MWVRGWAVVVVSSPSPLSFEKWVCVRKWTWGEKFEKKVIVCGIGVSLPHHHDKGTPRTKKTKGKEKSRFHFGYFLSGKMVVGKGGNQLVGEDSKRLFPNLFIISVDLKKASCFLPERWVISFPSTFFYFPENKGNRGRGSLRICGLLSDVWCYLPLVLGGEEQRPIR